MDEFFSFFFMQGMEARRERLSEKQRERERDPVRRKKRSLVCIIYSGSDSSRTRENRKGEREPRGRKRENREREKGPRGRHGVGSKSVPFTRDSNEVVRTSDVDSLPSLSHSLCL